MSGESDQSRVTLEMYAAAMEAYRNFDLNADDPEAMVWAILSRAIEVMPKGDRLDQARPRYFPPGV